MSLVAVVAFVLLGAGCSDSSSDTPLPDPVTTLHDAAATARNMKTVHIALSVNGSPQGMPLRGVDGDVAVGGNARGTLKIDLAGALIEGEFRVVDNTAYFKGPTGGFQKLSAQRAASLYDSSALLDPQRGIANLLAKTTDPKAESVEDVNGVSAYKITGKAEKAVVAPLVPGIGRDVDVTLWLSLIHI